MALGIEWREQIAGIIAQTEHNLGIKTRPPPRQNAVFRPAPALFAAQAPPVAAAPASAQVDGCYSGFSLSAAAASAAATAEMRSLPEMSLDSTRGTQTRLLESVKFELDVRGKHASAQLDAVREEMTTSMQATERKWVDIAKQVESSVTSQVEAEAKLRGHTDTQLWMLREASAVAHQETLRVVSEFQQTAIDHSEVLRRLDTDLSSFRQNMETRLAEESRRITTLVESQHEAGVAAISKQAAAAEQQLSTAHEGRLGEMENALLQERDFRKGLERQLVELRDTSGAMSNMDGAIESAVGAALEKSGTSSMVISLDEKVKECGRLIVRMGTELMEETKRRQALEAEVQELRMRISGVEAVARSPLASTPGPYQYGPFPPPPGYPPNSGGAFPSTSWGEQAAVAAAAAGFGAATADYDGSGAGMHYDGSGAGMPPPADMSALGETAAASYAEGFMAGGGLGGGGVPFMSEAMRTPAGEGRVADTWDAHAQAAVDAKLRELVPSARGGGACSGGSAGSYAGCGGDEAAGSSFGLPSKGTNALRISRQELDARVQQILGRHGKGAAASTPS